MPLVPFESLPDDARVWVFAGAASLSTEKEQTFLTAVDDYLAQWKAHGAPLTVGREWREHRFLTVGVDTAQESASGCSIDGLFRILQGLESAMGTSLVGGGRVYYRNADGVVATVDRETFSARAEQGEITRGTTVFDPSVSTLSEWRSRFETTAGQSWHDTLLPTRS